MNIRKSFATAFALCFFSVGVVSAQVTLPTVAPIPLKSCTGSLAGAIIPYVHSCEGVEIRTGYGNDVSTKVWLNTEATLHVDGDPLDRGSVVELVFTRKEHGKEKVLAHKSVASGAYAINCTYEQNKPFADCALISLPLSPYGQYRELVKFTVTDYTIPAVQVKVNLGSQSILRLDLQLGKG